MVKSKAAQAQGLPRVSPLRKKYQKQQCTATSKRTHERCKAWALEGRTVCRHHGGRSLVGTAHPKFKHGRYSKYLPETLLPDFVAARKDKDLLLLIDEIGLVDTRLNDLVRRLDKKESGALWKSLGDAWKAYKTARDDMDAAHWLAEVGRLIQQGVGDWAIWNDIINTIDQRRKLVESERKRLVELQQMLTADQAMLLVSTLVDSVNRHVPDPKARSEIARDIAGIIGTTGQRTDTAAK